MQAARGWYLAGETGGGIAAMPVSLLSIVCLFGCGAPDTAQVSGRVLMADGSPPQGVIRVIRFEPTDDTTASVRKAGFADLEDDGTFEMMTRKYGDGVYCGKYKVTFSCFANSDGTGSTIEKKFETAATTPYAIEVTGNLRDVAYELEPR